MSIFKKIKELNTLSIKHYQSQILINLSYYAMTVIWILNQKPYFAHGVIRIFLDKLKKTLNRKDND